MNNDVIIMEFNEGERKESNNRNTCEFLSAWVLLLIMFTKVPYTSATQF